MKKITLSMILVLGIMLVTNAHFALADDVLDGVAFTNPESGEWYPEDVLIEWTNINGTEDMTLKTQEDSCDVDGDWNTLETNIDDGEFTHDWEASEGNHCLRMQEGDEYAYSGMFCIDDTEPAVAVETQEEILLNNNYIQGVESDTPTVNTISQIEVNLDDHSEEGNANCEGCELEFFVDWGDGTIVYSDQNEPSQEGVLNDVCIPNDSPTVDYVCYHQYTDSDSDDEDDYELNSVYEVTVTVTDCAGNENSGSDTVTVENVVPECEISGPTDAAVGQEVYFDGMAYDVDADLENMTYNWDFDDGESDTGMYVSHIFESAGAYNVMLEVDDTDGGVNTCSHEINVVEPQVLSNQEVAAFYPLNADFGEDGTGMSFFTDLSNTDECEIVMGPNNLRALENVEGENTCQIRWDKGLSAHPTNDERGTHHIIIRASDNSEGEGVNNEVDYDYFAFDITVWSWMIDVSEGWNLISIPLVPEESNAIEDLVLCQLGETSAVTAGCGDAPGVLDQDVLPGGTEYAVFSYQYDGADNVWKISRRSGFGDLDTVMPGYAYWIKATGEGTLRGNGVTNEGINPYPTVLVPRNSWMTVGRYGIVGLPWKKDNAGNQYMRMYGPLRNSVAFDSLDAPGSDLHVYGLNEDSDLDITEFIDNNEGYWLYVEDNNPLNDVESYTPIDEWYPENNGLSNDLP